MIIVILIIIRYYIIYARRLRADPGMAQTASPDAPPDLAICCAMPKQCKERTRRSQKSLQSACLP